MYFGLYACLLLAALPISVYGTPQSLHELGKRATSVSSATKTFASVSSATSTTSASGSACTSNTASTRSQWCDYDLSTDYYTTVPDTGVTREYYFEVTEGTAAPDGISRNVQSINGSIPGPTIEADWGDNIVVHVLNSASTNGTTLHFHGMRQNYTNQNDGVSSITQCPTPPGSSVTYSFRAVEYGSSWYHSHFSFQAYDGVFGGIKINGPAAANYDHDLGNLFVSDWSHETADYLYNSDQTVGPPTLDNGLINGTNTYNGTSGTRFETTFTSGSSYLLRLVNAAIDTHFSFSIDNHTMSVIAADFVPIVPYTTDVISIGIGQRYDVVVSADQSDVASDFWMRAIPDVFCSNNANADDIKGIVHYGDSTGTPTTSAYTYTEVDCEGEAYSSIVPYLSKTAGSPSTTGSNDVTAGTSSDGLGRWYLDNSTFYSEWSNPTALQVYNNITEFNSSANVMLAPTAGQWYYILMETSLGVPHPIHLHGHDFYVLAKDTGTYSSSVAINTDNPPRRDVEMLPPSGYLLIGFQSDNPGVWLMHCHIGWHTEQGLSLQVVEQYDSIMGTYNTTMLQDQCDSWDTYMNSNGLAQVDDDGI